MNCPEPIFDRRTNKTRICNAEIRGMTGLQELNAFQKHLRKKHKKTVDMLEALEYRAESEQ
jgi:hypothetical protein